MSSFATTWRLVLAALSLDDDAQALVDAEIGDDAQRWRGIAHAATKIVALDLIGSHGAPGLHPGGYISGRAVEHVEGVLAGALDAAERDKVSQPPERHQPRRGSPVAAVISLIRAAQNDVGPAVAVDLHTVELNRDQLITVLRLLYPLISEYFETKRATEELMDALDEGGIESS
jgi:hypothetical protein